MPTAEWRVAPVAPEEWRNRFPELHPVVAQLLYNRGLQTEAAIDEFLHPDYDRDVHDPFQFQAMRPAVERIFAAITSGEKVAIHGDYDADGVSSSAVLMITLRTLLEQFGDPVRRDELLDIFIPHREKEGYGLRTSTVEYFAQRGTQLIITVDCGMASTAEIQLAVERGMDVIVTDHHQPLHGIPPALAVINPHTPGETYPFTGLAGVGVAFKLAQALAREGAQRQPGYNWEGFEKWLLDLVAIGTVADIMPLVGENRTLVKYGLVVLNKTPRPGLRALLFKSNLNGGGPSQRDKLPTTGINAYTIAFKLGPRLNAAGRMDHANTAYQLLLTDDPAEAETLSDSIQQSNAARQTLTDTIVGAASEQLESQRDEALLVAQGNDWPTGVLGLVASRLMERYQKPIIVVSLFDGQMVASGRSLPHFDIVAPLQKLEQYLDRYGGHPAACGFALKAPDVFADFVRDYRALAAAPTVATPATTPLTLDAVLPLADATWPLVDGLAEFEPFGEKNERPQFLVTNATLTANEPLGRDGKHRRLMVRQGTGPVRKVVAFSPRSDIAQWQAGDTVDLVVDVGVNEWNGNREIQLKLIDGRRGAAEPCYTTSNL